MQTVALQCLLKVKQDLCLVLIFQHAILNAKKLPESMCDIIVIFRKIKTILILISFKRYFLHPEKSILNLTPAKFCSTNWRCSRTVLEHLELF